MLHATAVSLKLQAVAPTHSPRGIDPDNIEMTEVNTLLIHPVAAGASLGPQVFDAAVCRQVGVCWRMAQTYREENYG